VRTYTGGADNQHAVASGVGRSASIITSAAAIRVVLFGSFGFAQFTATPEFGLGLAFAVALDATLIRLLLVPALMELFGSANWWWPAGRWEHAGPQQRTRNRPGHELE
jgi:RND superfamily putative drug exporter